MQSFIAKKQGKDTEDVSVTTGWWNSFRKRHPQLTVRTASRLSYVRAIAHDPNVFENYFDLLEETLVKNKLLLRTNSCMNQHAYSTVKKADSPWSTSLES